jgi:hypothetical protein
MRQADPRKCANVLCSCNASDTYCGQACKEADSRDTDIACRCGHQGCVAHINFSAPGSAQDSLSKNRG